MVLTEEKFLQRDGGYSRTTRLLYKFDKKGLLVSLIFIGGSSRTTLLETIRRQKLGLFYYPALTGRPSGTGMHDTLRRHFYWPVMENDVY